MTLAGRTKYGLKNMQVAVFFMIATYLLTFVSRSVLITSLGSSIVGLNSTLVDILGFLNLAELGITSAVSGLLYKPLFYNDRKQVNDIISVFGYLYRIIGFTILAGGVIVSLFLPLIFNRNEVPMFDVYMGFYTFLSTTLIGYFISYRQTLFVADQKQYVVTFFTNLSTIIKLIIQIIALKYFNAPYYCWLIIELIFGSLYGFIINARVNKGYPWLETSYQTGKKVRKEYKILFKKIKQIIPHQFGAFVQFQASSIIIYSFTSLATVTIYTNYTLILTKASTFIKLAFSGTISSIGNLLAEGNRQRIISVFNEYNSLFFTIGGVLCILFYYLVNPFIKLWVGESFYLGHIAFIILIINTYFSIVRIPVMFFMGAYLLYADTWAPIAEAVTCILVSVVGGYFWGIAGVLLGQTVSLLMVIMIWKPYYLYKVGFRTSVIHYWKKVSVYLLILLTTLLSVEYLYQPLFLRQPDSFTDFVINAAGLSLYVSMVYLIQLVFVDKGIKDVIHRFLKVF